MSFNNGLRTLETLKDCKSVTVTMWFCTIDGWSPSPAGVPPVDAVLALHGQGRSYSCTSIKDFDENALTVIVFHVGVWGG